MASARQGMAIGDVGRFLKRYGIDIGEHPEFGGVKPGAHAPNSFHKYGEAIDVRDWRADNAPEYEGGPVLNWKQRTANLRNRARELGFFDEALGPGDKGHDTHVHLAFSGRKPIQESDLLYLATGRRSGSSPSGGGAGGGIPPLDARRNALLDTIAYAEGTWDPKKGARRYDIAYTGARFDPSKGHPRQVRSGGGWSSDAAGAYQFLSTTWDETAGKLGLKDFSPQSQDRAALELVKRRVGDRFDQEGLSDRVFKGLGQEWASLPGSPYGQPTKDAAELRKFYNQRLQARGGATGGGDAPAPPSGGGGGGGGDELDDAFVRDFLAKGTDLTRTTLESIAQTAGSILNWSPGSGQVASGLLGRSGYDMGGFSRSGSGSDFFSQQWERNSSRMPDPLEIARKFGLF